MQPDPALNGYLNGAYAAALSEIGHPRRLPGSGAWILERPIPGTNCRDAMGCYPLFCSPDWAVLKGDLDGLGPRLVSLCAVTDPFAEQSEEQLKLAFRDLVRPYKKHYVVDLTSHTDKALGAHHRRNVRKGVCKFTLVRLENAAASASEWVDLYSHLIQRHGIKGLAAFSPASLASQLNVSGAVVFRAERDGHIEGMTVWYTQGTVGYYHLGAYTDAGYRLRASYALFNHAIGHFQSAGLRWLDLGGAPGLEDDQSGGLARFKQGWSSETRMTYLCGRIFDAVTYQALAKRSGAGATSYFPAYRAP